LIKNLTTDPYVFIKMWRVAVKIRNQCWRSSNHYFSSCNFQGNVQSF